LNEADVSDKPSWIRALPFVDRPGLHQARVDEYRSLRAVDDAVKAIIRLQRGRFRLHNTLFVVISDNGVMWGEHRLTAKSVPYASATRVSLAIRWFGHVAQGVVDGRLALNLDVPVTIAAAAEAVHDDVAGRNLLQRWRRDGFVLEANGARFRVPGGFVGRPSYCGWRNRLYLYVRYANGVSELYDYARDPYELRNRGRAAIYREVRARLRSRAQASCQPPPRGFSW
jgi:arylsulfatase A-like enzyme